MNTHASSRPTGMAGFLVIWAGQVISILASGMSSFALSIWLFQQTRSATAMGAMQVCYLLPFLALSPIAGVLVDRHSRKFMMMISDVVAVIATGGIFLLQALHRLQFWHLYPAAVLYGLGNTFQWPAYSAAMSIMIPKAQYGRANGLLSLMEAGPGVLAPILAGALLPVISLTGILLIDVMTFFVALGALWVVHIPQPPRTVEGEKGQGNIWQESLYGFRYIFQRPSLFGLQVLFFAGNLFAGMAFTVLAPMILLRTADNSVVYGSIQSTAAIGNVIGGVLMSLWGGFKRRVHGVLLGWFLTGIFMTGFGFGRDLTFWLPFMAAQAIVSPIINASNQAIWQAKVAPDVQGRVFSARRLIAWFAQPVAPLIAGLLADRWLEPSMTSGTGLSLIFHPWVGAMPGSGMALLFIFCGLGVALTALSGYAVPAISHVETLLPDYEVWTTSEPLAQRAN